MDSSVTLRLEWPPPLRKALRSRLLPTEKVEELLDVRVVDAMPREASDRAQEEVRCTGLEPEWLRTLQALFVLVLGLSSP